MLIGKLFSDEFLNFSLRYYMNVEGFKYIAISNLTEILILNQELLQSVNVSDLGIKLKAFPSFSKAAGSQGKLTQIALI